MLRATPHDYFQPAVAISGAITALGVAPWLTLLLWKPVAVVAGFWAARAYMRRSLTGLWERRAGLLLCLFFGCFTVDLRHASACSATCSRGSCRGATRSG